MLHHVKRTFLLVLMVGALLFPACAAHRHPAAAVASEPAEINRSIGHWEHRYPKSQLVGIWIQQLPDNAFEAPQYEGKHPCMVYYIFPNGRSHGFHYLPDGTIESEAWSQAPSWMLAHLNIVYHP